MGGKDLEGKFQKRRRGEAVVREEWEKVGREAMEGEMKVWIGGVRGPIESVDGEKGMQELCS